MIRYSLRCACDTEFESWFPSGASFDKQSKAGLIECPRCGSHEVVKAPMAPALRGAESARGGDMRQALKALREEIEAKTRDVGRDFPREAREMHDGLKPEAPIRGQATREEARALLEEGVPVFPLPPALEEMN